MPLVKMKSIRDLQINMDIKTKDSMNSNEFLNKMKELSRKLNDNVKVNSSSARLENMEVIKKN